ncbi:MAG: hypothetical protein PF574_03660 [Candidatus Delongbacteria bacterium]|jgi:hypothetical protein|nr:hypothetical protein [Candidatus Delongbacteria bacterium]
MQFLRTGIKVLFLFSVMVLSSRGFLPPKYDQKIPINIDKTSKAFVPYPENRVHRAGLFWLNITNRGILGNTDKDLDPCTGKTALRAEMPGGSGVDYLFGASLWFGGYIDSSHMNIDGVDATLFQGPLVSTSASSFTRFYHELQPIGFDEDPTGLTLGKIYESSNIEGKISCLFKDVYDPNATAAEQFTTMYTDKFVSFNYTGYDIYDKRDHIPLGIEVKQNSYAWPYDYAKKFIIVDYTIYNKNEDKKDIFNFFMGAFVAPEVGIKNEDSPFCFRDDICGFIEKWDNYFDPATGEQKSVDLNLIWFADNDGRNYPDITERLPIIEPSAGSPLDGATGVFTVRVLRNPNPNLRYSFNLFNSGWFSESLDWGPHWKTGLHSDWQYDLTSEQKGYDDNNYDNLLWVTDEPLNGGRTEGTPIGDIGRYMVMSNNEFDHNQTSIREVYLGMSTQVDGTPIPQVNKWQPWILDGEEQGGEIPDGSVRLLNDIANGINSDLLLSFGPLGYESYVNVAYDTVQDTLTILDGVKNQKAWKFAYGDSLKLTLAFMVSENFNSSLDQDPNYTDTTIVDLSDGLDISLYDQGWYDTFYNVTWVERVYDIPLYDTPVTKYGETKTDGWYGEDVGEDGMFADLIYDPNTYCWWTRSDYSGEDNGENDFEITDFTTPITDTYGHIATNEDELLPLGREQVDSERKYGITGSSDTGEGYGYMVKYDKLDGAYPQGTWVRYGYDNGKLDPGDGVPDFAGPPPPPSPKIKVNYDNNDVIISWCSHEFYEKDDGTKGIVGPEFFYDPFSRKKDFEGYQVQISIKDHPREYVEIFSIDRMNYGYENVVKVGEYLDNPVPKDSVLSNPELFPPTISYVNNIFQLTPFGDNRSMYDTHSHDELYTYTATPDTSLIDLYGVIWNYKFILHNKLYAKENFIAVTASDYGAPKSGVPPLQSSPSMNGRSIIPTKIEGTKDVVVVPNPYRDDVDYEAMGWENTDGGQWFEQDRKIVFMNLPEKCVLRIYTLAGDLVKTIGHNGNARDGVRYQYGDYGVSWDLINENQQAVVSGIYLFSVQAVDSDYEFVGKFVVIK